MRGWGETYALLTHHYGWSDEQIDELTYDQIQLYHHLALKYEWDRAKLNAAHLAEVMRKVMGF